jgi:cell division protein FtsA
MKPVVVAVDLGSFYVRVVVASIEEGDKGFINIIGRSYSNLHISATHNGNIVNLEKMRMAVKKAVEEAEMMADEEIERAFVGLSIPHMRGYDSEGDVNIQGKRRQVSREDIGRVFEAVKAIGIPKEYSVLHIIPQKYLVDGQGEYEDPLGATGTRLALKAHTLVCPTVAVNNHTSVCNQLGIKVARLIFEPLAAAEAVLTDDERERGVLLVDLGHESTQAVLLRKSSILHTFLQPFGARHVATDLMDVLKIGHAEAERVKKECRAERSKESGEEMGEGIEVIQAGSDTRMYIRKARANNAMWARVYELFDTIMEDLNRHHIDMDLYKAGVVLTGGGALLSGVQETAAGLMNVPVRVGYPTNMEGITEEITRPDWATVIGLVKFGFKYYPEECRVKRGLFSRLFSTSKS